MSGAGLIPGGITKWYEPFIEINLKSYNDGDGLQSLSGHELCISSHIQTGMYLF